MALQILSQAYRLCSILYRQKLRLKLKTIFAVIFAFSILYTIICFVLCIFLGAGLCKWYHFGLVLTSKSRNIIKHIAMIVFLEIVTEGVFLVVFCMLCIVLGC